MLAVLDALLTALYVLVDDLLPARSGPGRRRKLTDAELITLAIAQIFLDCPSERRFLRFVRDLLMHPIDRQRPAETVVVWDHEDDRRSVYASDLAEAPTRLAGVGKGMLNVPSAFACPAALCRSARRVLLSAR